MAKALGNIILEIYGLFVEDANFALSILIWLGVAWFLTSHTELWPGLKAVIFFAGLATILVGSAMLRARQ